MAFSSNTHVVGIGLAGVGASLFSLKGVIMKLAFAAGANVEQMMALRLGASLPVFLIVGAWFLRQRGAWPSGRLIMAAIGLGVLSYYVCTWLDFTGLQFISSQFERLILFLYPTFTALFAWRIHGDKITLRHGFALVLSYAGVLILFTEEVQSLGANVWLGGGLVLVSAILFAVYVTFSKTVIMQVGAPLFTSIAMSAAAVAILLHFFVQSSVFHAPSAAWTPELVGYGVFLALFCTVAPSFMMSEAISRIGPGLSSAVGGIGPVMTAMFAVVMLSEPFGAAQILALTLTVSGVMLLLQKR